MERDERVEKIFRELQKKGLIDKKRKLKAAKCENLQAAKLINAIKYNTKFTKKMSEDTIRFALLHEEGHKNKKQLSYVAIGFTLVFIFSLTYIGKLDSRSTYVICFFWVFVTVNIFNRLFSLDEYRADEYASEQIYKEYGISPYKIFKKFMKQTDEKNSKDPNWGIYIFYAFFGYHPLEIDRLQRIKTLEELIKDDE